MGTKNGFQSLLYYKFIFSKQHRVKPVAKKIGLSADNFYKIIRGADKPTKNLSPGNTRRYEFPVDLIEELYRATKDKDFLLYFIEPCGFDLVPSVANETVKSVLGHVTELLAASIGWKILRGQSE